MQYMNSTTYYCLKLILISKPTITLDIGIHYQNTMRKNEPKPKPPTKNTNTFGNAMSALSEMCYDYKSLGMNEGANKQVFAGKKP
jgi:hypothetical protein